MSINLLIAMPTQGMIATDTVKAIILLTQDLARKGVPFDFTTYEFSDIVFSRNQLMSAFLTYDRYTHMLCMDSDMQATPDAIWRLIDFDVDFAAIAYPQKFANLERLRALIEMEMAKPPEARATMAELRSRAWIWNHQLRGFGGAAWRPKRRDGFITVPATGTGLILLKRAVPEAMTARGLAPRLERMESFDKHKGLRYHDFFSHLCSPDGQIMYGEDQSFCMRWTEGCGGDIWLDTESYVNHVGLAAHVGRYSERAAEDFPEIADDD